MLTWDSQGYNRNILRSKTYVCKLHTFPPNCGQLFFLNSKIYYIYGNIFQLKPSKSGTFRRLKPIEGGIALYGNKRGIAPFSWTISGSVATFKWLQLDLPSILTVQTIFYRSNNCWRNSLKRVFRFISNKWIWNKKISSSKTSKHFKWIFHNS